MPTLTKLTPLAAIFLLQPALADITFIGRASIPGNARDNSGLIDEVAVPGSDKKVPHNLLGSFGSAIDYLGKDNFYIACNDRGPADGAVPWRARFHTFRILINPGDAEPVEVESISTATLSDESGRPLTGALAAFNAEKPLDALRFDPEGVRITPARTLLISDEYGPWIDEFTLAGRRVRRLPIPSKFLIDHPSADPKLEVSANTRGREANRGFEGLDLSPDGRIATAILQSPLLQDAPRAKNAKRTGTHIRMLQITLASGEMRELVYTLDDPRRGVSELLAVDDHRFLVLERDGEEAKSRSLYMVDTTKATDVSSIDPLPSPLPESIVPVAKSKWLDLMDPRWSLASDPASRMPEKIEGLCFGATLPDGRRTIIITTDNDLRSAVPTWFWVFAFNDADLAPVTSK